MLTLIDNITIVLCVVGIFAISVFMSKKNTDMEAYYHANKALPWSLAVGTIAASWYGGNGTIGTVGYVTTMGLSAFFIWSIGAHLVRFPLALWVAPRISVKVNSTMTELLDLSTAALLPLSARSSCWRPASPSLRSAPAAMSALLRGT